MDFYTRAVMNMRPNIDPEEIEEESCSYDCFDSYIRKQRDWEGFAFRPEVYAPCLNEFREYLFRITGINIYKIPYSSGFFSVKYPTGYTDSMIYSYNYMFHQLMRIPTIVENISVSLDREPFQEFIDAVHTIEPYWGFEVQFDWKDFVRCIRPVEFSILHKQTSALLQIMSPYYCKYGEYYILENFNMSMDTVRLIKDLRPDLLLCIPGISEKPGINSNSKYVPRTYIRSTRCQQ